ncbi:MAG: TolC family protein, partial [Cyclobacteriaceae bacterium]|nr:TolC family protein [Cyclobacteriaceae bacterium]
MRLFKYIFLIPLSIVYNVYAQDSLLSKRDAVDLALENNYDIRIAEGNVESAENSASIYNSGYLPSISASGGANYNVVDNFVELQDGSS